MNSCVRVDSRFRICRLGRARLPRLEYTYTGEYFSRFASSVAACYTTIIEWPESTVIEWPESTVIEWQGLTVIERPGSTVARTVGPSAMRLRRTGASRVRQSVDRRPRFERPRS